MKKTKVIIPAMGLLLLSTAASITGTVAWFAVNTSVTVEGLSVKAKAEGGIVIAPYAFTGSSLSDEGSVGYLNTLTHADYVAPQNGDFGNSANATFGGQADLYPTSTPNASAWYHATSNNINNYAASSAYTTLSGLEADGKAYSGDGLASATAYKMVGQYYLHAKYKVKATSLDDFSLYVTDVSVTGDSQTVNLNKSVRIAVKVGTNDLVTFAPKYSSETLYYWSGSARTAYTSANLAQGAEPDRLVADGSVAAKAVNNTGVDLDIWVYYEGEDENCKTANAAFFTIDALAISLTFSTTL